MSRRVAVRNNGDSVEKLLANLAKPLVKPLAGAMGLQTVAAGKQAAKTAVKESFTDKVKDSAAHHAGKQLANAPKEVARASQEKIAEQNKQAQQSMEQRGQQMADKAKTGSQIATGEPMDMSWQMLKAWSFLPGFSAFEKHLVIEHAKKMKLKHVSIHDLGHHDKRFNERYKPDQEMPKGAEKLTPRDLALAYMDLMLRRNPELIERGNQKSKVGGKDENGNPHPDNFPGISFPLLQTDEPIRSQVKTDKGRMIEQYHPVFAAGHARHEPSEEPRFGLVTANDMATQAGNRNTIGVTHTVNRYSHDHYPIGDDEAEQAFYDGEDALPTSISPQARNKKIIADEINRRHYGDFLQPIDYDRMKRRGLSSSINQKVAEARVYGQNPMAVDSMNPLKIYPEGSPLARQYRRYQDANPVQEEEEEEKPPTIVPAGPGMVFFNGKLMNESDVPVQTGEPMDMAWRMLKGELQLPHQITEALRGDLTTLDRAHKMTDTNEGTLIENIHPDMENVVKLLAEKHLGDLTPTMQRPVMPLFHSPFH